MAQTLFIGKPTNTNGNLPNPGEPAPDFSLVASDLSDVTLKGLRGKKLILNIFPSIDTSTCATSVRKFNEMAAALSNTQVICISRDLPFAQKRFCGAEGIENVSVLSDFRDGSFGRAYGVELTESAFKGLHARAIVVIDESGVVVHSELVGNISDEPDYQAAINSI